MANKEINCFEELSYTAVTGAVNSGKTEFCLRKKKSGILIAPVEFSKLVYNESKKIPSQLTFFKIESDLDLQVFIKSAQSLHKKKRITNVFIDEIHLFSVERLNMVAKIIKQYFVNSNIYICILTNFWNFTQPPNIATIINYANNIHVIENKVIFWILILFFHLQFLQKLFHFYSVRSAESQPFNPIKVTMVVV